MSDEHLDIKLDDFVAMYGLAKCIGKDDYIGYLNGVKGQVVDIHSAYGCTTLTVREFDLNEGKVQTWEVHVMQVRKVKR